MRDGYVFSYVTLQLENDWAALLLLGQSSKREEAVIIFQSRHTCQELAGNRFPVRQVTRPIPPELPFKPGALAACGESGSINFFID